jgi:hypothetical protein
MTTKKSTDPERQIDDASRAALVLGGVVGKRVTYRQSSDN